MTMYRNNHFTLVEIVLALTILAMLGVIVGTSLNIFLRGYQRSQKAAAELERNLTLDRFADGVLARSIAFHWHSDDTLTDELVFRGDYEELWLSTLRPADRENGGAFLFGRLYVENDELRFDYSEVPLLPWMEIDRQRYATETLATNVERIAFRYAEREDDEIVWYEEWNEDDHPDIPLAIQLEVFFRDNTSERWLRRAPGATGNSTLGTRQTGTSS